MPEGTKNALMAANNNAKSRRTATVGIAKLK
jgi:hypothetical protein